MATVKGERDGGWYAITEPSGGSDPARAIQTRAVRKGGDWILNGSKLFITGSLQGDWGYVFARTDPNQPRGITCFIVENAWSGFSVTPVPVMRPYYPGHLVFDNVRVPGRNVLGEPNRGWDILANRLLSRLRIPYAAANLGVAVAAHRMAVDYSKTRSTFGAPLSSRQSIQWMLVDSEVEIPRLPLADTGGRLEVRRRGRLSSGRQHRQALLFRDPEQRRGPLHPGPRRVRSKQGDAPGAMVPGGAHSPESEKAPRRSSA